MKHENEKGVTLEECIWLEEGHTPMWKEASSLKSHPTTAGSALAVEVESDEGSEKSAESDETDGTDDDEDEAAAERRREVRRQSRRQSRRDTRAESRRALTARKVYTYRG